MQAALRQPGLATIDEVADAYAISRHHLGKVVHGLAQKGYLKTRRGIGGGFTLGMPPARIGVGAVVRLTEEDANVIECVNRATGPCAILPACRLRSVLAEAAAAFYGALDRYTLEDLVQRRSEMRELLGI